MSAAIAIDAAWRGGHPLPALGTGLDKDSRGQVLVLGGSAFVPGAVSLTAEAALRVGAGKVQVATPSPHAAALGATLPEMSIIALPVDADGEVALAAADSLAPHLDGCQALVLGCGMGMRAQTATLLARLLAGAKAAVIDAGMLGAVAEARDAVAALDGRAILTPHPGELAKLTGEERAAIEADPVDAARRAAAAFGAIVVLKQDRTIVADPAGTLLSYVSDSPGLGTAGSGDVLAGVIGGVLARGMAPLEAAAWGVWLHGQAGATLATTVGPVGFLARELLPAIPRLLAAQATG